MSPTDFDSHKANVVLRPYIFVYIWVYSTFTDFSHHRDYYMSRGFRTKPSFARNYLARGTSQCIFFVQLLQWAPDNLANHRISNAELRVPVEHLMLKTSTETNQISENTIPVIKGQ